MNNREMGIPSGASSEGQSGALVAVFRAALILVGAAGPFVGTANAQDMADSVAAARSKVASLDGGRFGLHDAPTKALQGGPAVLRRMCESAQATFEVWPEIVVFRDRRPDASTTHSEEYPAFMACVAKTGGAVAAGPGAVAAGALAAAASAGAVDSPSDPAAGGAALWGVRMSVDKPELLPSSITRGTDYYGALRYVFLTGDEADAQRGVKRREVEAARNRAQDCQAQEAERRTALRASPQIGQVTSVGTVIELRLPMALLQLNAQERVRQHRDQQWVNAASLDIVRGCR